MSGVNRGSHFSRWITKKKYSVRSNTDATHLLLSGGILKIDDEETALKLLAKDVSEGVPNYVVERRTPVFKLCMDFDFVTILPTGIDIKTLLAYMQCVQRVVGDVYPHTTDGDRRVVICHAPLKVVNKEVKIDNMIFCDGEYSHASTKTEARDVTKSGYHAIWPTILVNWETAVRIRFIIKQRLETAFPNFATHTITLADGNKTVVRFDDWNSVLDLQIYTMNGLRMIGSNKATKCKVKHDTLEVPCECAFGGTNTGYIDNGRPYGIACILDANGKVLREETEHLVNNPPEAFIMTSIRTTAEPTSQFIRPEWFTYESEVQGVVHKATRGSSRQQPDPGTTLSTLNNTDWGVVGERRQVRIGNSYQEFEIVSRSDPRFVLFEKFLHEAMPHGIEQLTVQKMLISTVVSKPYIFAVGSSKYCANVGREHSGQDIYYLFNGKKVEQRCWSSKEEGDRLHGPCNGAEAATFFRSKAIAMPSTVKAQIFPLSIQHKFSLTLPTPPPMENSRALVQMGNVEGNRHPTVTTETIQRQQIVDQIRHEIINNMIPKYHWSFVMDGNEEEDEGSAE